MFQPDTKPRTTGFFPGERALFVCQALRFVRRGGQVRAERRSTGPTGQVNYPQDRSMTPDGALNGPQGGGRRRLLRDPSSSRRSACKVRGLTVLHTPSAHSAGAPQGPILLPRPVRIHRSTRPRERRPRFTLHSRCAQRFGRRARWPPLHSRPARGIMAGGRDGDNCPRNWLPRWGRRTLTADPCGRVRARYTRRRTP